MTRGFSAVVALVAGLLAAMALADRTSASYIPLDGGSVQLPTLSARSAMEPFNAYPVAICIAAGTSAPPSAPCRPVLPGGTISLDVSDAHKYSARFCSGTTVASCLGDGGIITTEIQ